MCRRARRRRTVRVLAGYRRTGRRLQPGAGAASPRGRPRPRPRLFGSIPSEYVPSFTVGQTREMVRKLGRYMGLHFDEMLYAKLVEDFGSAQK